MPKKATTKTTVQTVDAPVSDSKSKVKKTRPSKTPKVVESVDVKPVEVADVVTPEQQSEDSASSTVGSDLSDNFQEFIAKLQAVCSSMQSLKADFRALEKKFNRELKTAQKAASKKKRKTGNRQPSGFVKPTLISVELATFLGKPEGTQMARTEVTREINAYIRKHNLQDQENGRKINADKALSTLLKLKKEDELTYFNLQKFMSPHFAKQGQVPVAN